LTGYAIEELVGIFRLLQQQRWSAILIGGQAVNLYANHYADQIIDIESYRPLASRDLDFHGGPVDARRAMSILNADGKINDGTDPSPNAGVLRVPMQTGDTLIIDILTSVFGVSASELVRSSKTWNLLGQVEMEVIHPLLLFESKLACLRGLPQQGRQDRKHVQLMSQVMRAWLAEHLDSPREVYRAIERIAAMMHSSQPRRSDDSTIK